MSYDHIAIQSAPPLTVLLVSANRQPLISVIWESPENQSIQDRPTVHAALAYYCVWFIGPPKKEDPADAARGGAKGKEPRHQGRQHYYRRARPTKASGCQSNSAERRMFFGPTRRRR